MGGITMPTTSPPESSRQMPEIDGQVAAERQSIVITKHGKPLVQLLPMQKMNGWIHLGPCGAVE